jgi:hypothetical protein
VTIRGPWFISRAALEDYGRLTGRGAAPPRSELEAEIERAHFVRHNDDGSEVWRGGKPLRLRFIVRLARGVGGDAPQLVRVEGDHAGRGLQTPRVRTIRVWDGASYQELAVTDEVNETGVARRVAYRLSSGDWVTGTRGRTRPDHVEALKTIRNVPDWVRLQRGQTLRRGKDR